jgi:hypothetical protein
MWKRLGRGWCMARGSISVLRHHPKLMILPAISMSLILVVIGLLFLSLLPQIAGLHAVTGAIWERLGADAAGQAWYFAGLFVVVYGLVAATVFCNAALIHCALRGLNGQEPSLRAGLAAAAARMPQILGWALVASTIGLVLHALQHILKNLGFIGELVGDALEFGWSIATYFVVPVVVIEGVGPIAAVRRSAAILRHKWGESLGGEGRFALLAVLCCAWALLVFFAGLALALSGGAAAWLGALLIGLGIASGLAGMVALQALSAVFQAGVYVYATTGTVPPALDADLVAGAFARRS